MTSLGQVQREPRLAAAVRAAMANLAAVTAADLQAAATQYLVMAKALRILVQPEAAAK
jgi:hypothetical protein